MALITWNDSLTVNVVEIDRQHKRLIDMINIMGTDKKYAGFFNANGLK
jgi:hemerythrin